MVSNLDLVEAITKDNLSLKGLYSKGNTKTACIYIHGFTGTFYDHLFVEEVANTLKQKGNTFVLAQTRGTGGSTEIIKTDNRSTAVFIGSFNEKLEDAHLDISAWIEFLAEKGYKRIVLIGHSLGTIKSVRYLFEGEYKDKIKALVLLSPFDKNAFVEKKTQGKWHEYLKEAKKMIENGKTSEIVDPSYEDYPMSYENFFSWYQETELNQIWDFYKQDYSSNILRQIKIPTQIIFGDSDSSLEYPEFSTDAGTITEKLEKEMPSAEIICLKDCGHIFVNHESELAKLLSDFISKLN